MTQRYTVAPGYGDWLTDLLTPAGTTASLDAAKQITAALEAQCKAAGGKLEGMQCVFPTGAKVSIPQPTDVIPGMRDVRLKAEKTVADIAQGAAAKGGEVGVGRAIIVGALIVTGVWWLVRYKR